MTAPQVRKLLGVYGAHRGVRIAVIVAATIPLGLLAYVVVVPRIGGHRDVALDALAKCAPAADALGGEVGFRSFGIPWGQTESTGGATFASWSIPVKGASGTGKLSYSAYEPADEWDLIHASLSVDGQSFLVAPCWGKVSEADAQAQLTAGYEGTGQVSEVQGAAPVKVGDECSFRIVSEPTYPSTSPFNCQLRLTCAGQVLFGASDTAGYAFCHARGGKPLLAADRHGTRDSGDPILEADLERHRLRFADDGPEAYSFMVTGL